MTFQELIERLAEDTRYTKREVRSFLRIFAHVVEETLMSGRDVQLWGLGNFVNAPAAARSVMDPRTKEQIIRPATRRVKFVVGQKLKHRIKETQELFEPVDVRRRFGIKEE